MRHPIHVALCLLVVAPAGCDAQSDDGPTLEDRMAKAEEHIDAQAETIAALQTELEHQKTAHDAARARADQAVALIAAHHTDVAPPTPGVVAKQGHRFMDPDLERRVDEAGVRVLEKLTEDDNLEAMGELGRKFLEQELERRKK